MAGKTRIAKARAKTAAKPKPKSAKALAGKRAAKVTASAAPIGVKMRVARERVVIAKENPRHGQPVEDREAITASMKAHGQLQDLICYKSGDRWAATDGARRHAGARDAGFAELDIIVYDKADAIELGVAAQVERVNLHPADEAIAYARQIKGGDKPAEVAAAFGVTERFVMQRQKLAGLHPPILKALKANEISVDQASAWANVAADRQAALWKKIGARAHYSQIQRETKKAKVKSSDALARFVTVEAYEAAGGAVDRDLFAFDQGAGESVEEASTWIADKALLDKLAMAKVDEAIAAYVVDGWGFVKWHADGRPYGLYIDAPKPAKTAAERGKQGVVLSLTEAGKIKAEKGLLNAKAARKQDARATGRTKNAPKGDLGTRAHDCAVYAACIAVGREMVASPGVAIVALAAVLARQVFEIGDYTYSNALDIQCQPLDLDGTTPLKTDAAWSALHATWRELLLPGAADLEQHISDTFTPEARIELLAFCAASATLFSSRDQSADGAKRPERVQLATLGRLAGVKPEAHFAPDVEFCADMSTPALAKACAELGVKPLAKHTLTAEAVSIAAADKGWVPPLIRQLVGVVEAPAKGKAKPAAKKGARK